MVRTSPARVTAKSAAFALAHIQPSAAAVEAALLTAAAR